MRKGQKPGANRAEKPEKAGARTAKTPSTEPSAPAPEPSRRRRLRAASAFKRQTFFALDDIRHAEPFARGVGIALFILIILNAVVVFIWADPQEDPLAYKPVMVFYSVSTICFLLEYLARLWTADLLYGSLPPWRARLRYVTSGWGIIDLLAFLPNVIAWFVPLTNALKNTVTMLRLVRLVKVSRYMRGLETIGRVISKRRHEIVASLMVVLLLIVVASVLMYEVEHPAQPDKFNNLLTGIYWAATSITSTGYGDIVPITTLGRMLGSLIMVLAVGIIAIPGGILSAGFVAEFQNTSTHRIERLLEKDEEEQREERESYEQALEQTKPKTEPPEQ